MNIRKIIKYIQLFYIIILFICCSTTKEIDQTSQIKKEQNNINAQNVDIILNEYNAVDSNKFLNGGDKEQDIDRQQAFDNFFGRVEGNGGDWFELVVIKDHLDVRNWTLEYSWYDKIQGNRKSDTLLLTDHFIWSNLRNGTIITISENLPDDINYNPENGDWSFNVQANKDFGTGIYIEKKNITVNENNWQLTILDKEGNIKLGPVGEGIYPVKGINNEEIFRLEANPDETITPDSNKYDDADSKSTFGTPNCWGKQIQDFHKLRKLK